MLKGCQKKVIFIKNPGKYFDSAYFIVRHGLPPTVGEGEMLRAARQLADSAAAPTAVYEPRRPARRRGEAIIAYLSGAATVTLIGGAIALAANFCF